MAQYIEVIGLLGAGKTTLLQKVEKALHNKARYVYEDLGQMEEVWNYHKNRNSYYLLQTAYYLNSFNRVYECANNRIVIVDFSLNVHHYVYSHYLYANNLIAPVEWKVLDELFNSFRRMQGTPVGFIYLDLTPKESLQHLHERGRALDKNTSIEYLENLHDAMKNNHDKIVGNIPTVYVNTIMQGKTSEGLSPEITKFIARFLPT